MILMFDLDDTLLNKDGIISSYTINILNKYKKDNLYVINSARSLDATKKLLFNFKPDYLILNAASTIYDKNLNLIYSNPFSIIETQNIINELKKRQIFNILIESGEGFKTDNLEFIKNHNYASYSNLNYYNNIAYKIVYHSDNKHIGEQIALKYNLDFTTYVNTNINKFSKTTKGEGLIILKKILNYKDKIMAFGDDLGDLSMLLNSDIPIIMANSHPKLKEFNFNITKCNNDDGVAYFIEHYFKQKEGI